MKNLFSFGLAAFLLLSPVSSFGGEAAKKAGSDWERAIVSVETNRKQYDYFQPWTKRVQTLTKAGLVIGPHEILTTADDLDDRTLVRAQKASAVAVLGSESPAERAFESAMARPLR